MAFVVLTRPNLAALKSSLINAFPEVGSGHADEALAAGVGFRSHAALLATLKAQGDAHVTVVLDERLVAQRINDLSGQDIATEKLGFWLLRWEVEALPENNGAARRAVYEKARAALVEQLRATIPPPHPRDITANRLQLEDRIRQLEHEASGAPEITSPQLDPTQIQLLLGDWWKHVANQN